MQSIYLSKKKCLIRGDDNINRLKQSNISKEYLNLLRSEGFSPLIFEATRVTESNQTCIDHIYTNLSLPSMSGSIAVEIADHLPVISILYNLKIKPHFRISLNIETSKEWMLIWPCAIQRRQHLKSGRLVSMQFLLPAMSMSVYLDSFTFSIDICNQHALLKLTKVKNRTSKPWITPGLKKSMKARDKLYKKWIRTLNILLLNKYKLYHNKN